MRLTPVIFILLSVMLCTCLKPPQYSNIPAIVFQSVGFDSVSSGNNDSVSVTFKDGDGDLGTNIQADSVTDSNLCKTIAVDSFFSLVGATFPKAFDLFYLDSRANNGLFCMKQSQIPVIPANGSSRAISGTITFQTYPLTPRPGFTVDTLSYYVMIRDQAGHCSNIVRTNTIYITQ